MKITGDVEGHGFRFCAAYFANGLDISGYTEYDDDHSLVIVAQGDDDSIPQFIEKCKIMDQGTDSLVFHVQETEPGDYTGFVIRKSKLIIQNSSGLKNRLLYNNIFYKYVHTCFNSLKKTI
jgi:acylphosphatase